MRRLLIPLALTVGVLWWWAVLRLALAPVESGPVEGAVAIGGWGLGLLPVHCVPRPERARRKGGPGDGGTVVPGVTTSAVPAGPASTRASTLHRSGEGSGPS
ncbi:hypothetical protein OHA84_26075 [Streptomyces sp. NBC_00513]|uniref:hypothetical protein n=1 Tax=unclassified Streptomyces TaxID=2593676 RepID=UPI00099C5705|nr:MULTISPECIES: hypothetical protein [unclassified Streptomyces]MCX5073019.1 hypothetical protein [Streptomyces sp. NBC_00424]MCX5155449.1 hypothetical protein [Streptomyces sp. NBC_00291]WUD43690.1 hypothetical protein OHA84_26075 [Streptomyces sp. NBC_00513]